tara:strand:+ start:10350 stop:11870 length:1521 start_codon:yes stop_codon:yes gene_type:complete
MKKNLNSEINYYFWLYKQKIKKIKYHLEILSSLLFFYIPFISFDWKIKYLSPKAIPLLNKNFFKYFFSIDLQIFASNYLNENFQKDNLSLENITKLCWLIASFRENKDYTKKILKLFNGNKSNLIGLLKKRYQFLHPFTLLGDYDHLDSLLVLTREKLNFLEKRKEGFYKESEHFTAIGHLCLFAFLLQGVECNFLSKDINEYIFIYDPNRVQNKLFGNLLKDLAKKLNIKVLESNGNESNSEYDSELEIWPSQKTKYKALLARSEYYKLATKISNRRNLLKVPEKCNLLSKKIIGRSLIDKYKFFIGLHLRATFDERTGRNTSIENSKYICKLIKSEGGIPLLVGANAFLSRELQDYALDIKSICNNMFEYETLQLFIWENCKFWVGSQSGGTLPASLFGNLTLWLDFHPSGHFHPPNTRDIFLPRRVFSTNLDRFLTWEEATSDRYRFCQTENLMYAKHFGYKLLPAHKESVDKAFYFAINKSEEKPIKNKKSDLSSRVFYKDH